MSQSPPTAPPTATVRVASLDGLRAVSILLVVLHHAAGSAGAPPALLAAAAAIDAGNLGVRVFFVISGYLITGILARELARTQTISLRTFYYRRTIRIFPPVYFFIGVMLVLALSGAIVAHRADFVAAFTFTLNFQSSPWNWSLGHLWSLAVEEQFYLLWPVGLLLLGTRRAAFFAAALVLVVPWMRMAAALGRVPGLLVAVLPFAVHADWLAAGALLALGARTLRRASRYRRLSASGWWTSFLVASALVAWTAGGHWRARELTSGWTVVAVALLIDQLTNDAHVTAARLLAAPAMAWIGRISYSLYLWQQVFLWNHASTAWWAAFPANIILAFAAASASYYGIERPVLAWRDRARHTSPA